MTFFKKINSVRNMHFTIKKTTLNPSQKLKIKKFFRALPKNPHPLAV